MSLTFAIFGAAEVVTDPEAVIHAVNRACTRGRSVKLLQAVCGVGDTVYFILRPCDEEARPGVYRLVALTDESQDGFVAAVTARNQGSVDITGTFSAHGTTFAVFRDNNPHA